MQSSHLFCWCQPDRLVFPCVQVDGTKEVGLLSRFSVRHYPSIFHINMRELREYNGPRTAKDIAAFARTGWRTTKPTTGCASPVSRCGRAFGEVSKLPARFKAGYAYLRHERQYSDVLLLTGLLSVPVALGLATICFLDMYYSRVPPEDDQHDHHD